MDRKTLLPLFSHESSALSLSLLRYLPLLPICRDKFAAKLKSETTCLLCFFCGTTIPDSYGNMSKLFKLSLRNCNLQGPIPDLSTIPNLGYAKVNQANKIQKENSTFVASNAHGEKYRKPKPTNLKPFRFRTDERRMFKEATLEKKAHAPLK
ncbi:hypothetical protein DVH24_001536 [Malus domestica]|uniref:Uncharacterized protein n=1 Tax=Malus domestica TaxID=3750 RepID=A0A498K7H7_MALDO|nr:hypothetical protein DVH24_001536 [Malus domestica]